MVCLVRDGSVIATGADTTAVTSLRIETRFDLRGVAASEVTLEVENPDGSFATCASKSTVSQRWWSISCFATLVAGISKFREGMPLYRQSQSYQKSGITLATSTLGDWIAASADLYEPVHREARRQTLSSYLLSLDDTGLPVLDREDPRGIRRGHLWTYLGDQDRVGFSKPRPAETQSLSMNSSGGATNSAAQRRTSWGELSPTCTTGWCPRVQWAERRPTPSTNGRRSTSF